MTTRVMGTYGYAAPEYIATGYILFPNEHYNICLEETSCSCCQWLQKDKKYNRQKKMVKQFSSLSLYDCSTGHLYVKSDVYGFGVVLLEMLTGLRALDTRRPSGKQNLVDWAKPSLSSKRKLKTIMDSRVEGQYSSKAALEAAQLTLKCLGSDPKSRPSMKEVVEVLEKIEAMSEKQKESKTKLSTGHHPLPLPPPRHQRYQHAPRLAQQRSK